MDPTVKDWDVEYWRTALGSFHHYLSSPSPRLRANPVMLFLSLMWATVYIAWSTQLEWNSLQNTTCKIKCSSSSKNSSISLCSGARHLYVSPPSLVRRARSPDRPKINGANLNSPNSQDQDQILYLGQILTRQTLRLTKKENITGTEKSWYVAHSLVRHRRYDDRRPKINGAGSL